MATKIRLQRGGRKGYAFYRIVIADARAPRDGRFTEKIGTYNPNTDPATVDLNFDRALYWVETGAQPTDTVRSILRKEGVYMMKHLRVGVKKGAFDEATAQSKFDAWKDQKVKGMQLARKLRRQRRLLQTRSLKQRRRLTRLLLRKLQRRKLQLQPLLPRLRPLHQQKKHPLKLNISSDHLLSSGHFYSAKIFG